MTITGTYLLTAMPLQLSNRHESILQSEIRSMTIACNKAGGINLAQGICDTEAPALVRSGAREAIDKGINMYTRYDGRQELREAIAAFYRRQYAIACDPEKEIIVAAGATGAMYCAFMALLNPGDEVLVFEPYYGYHVNTLISQELIPRFVRLRPPRWSFTPEELEKAVSPRTRGIIVNTPANPCGKIFTREELEAIGAFARRHDLFVFTDEIYEHFVYDGLLHVPPMSIPGLKERTITVGGLSKTFSITGWRIGYCICDKRWAQTIGYFNDLIYVCAPAPLQIGAAKGLNGLPREYYRDLSRAYCRKRDKIAGALLHADIPPFIPSGSYYVLADISKMKGTTARERTLHFLEATHIATVPGNAFYHDRTGETMARFCFAKEDHIIDEVCRRIERFKR
jgi:aminotransferase